jgi:hypothetical protein
MKTADSGPTGQEEYRVIHLSGKCNDNANPSARQRNNFGSMEGEACFEPPVREVGYPKVLIVRSNPAACNSLSVWIFGVKQC